MTDRDFFVHLRLAGGAVTLAVVAGGRVGVAFCSPKENFSRKKGRDIALGRTKSKTTPFAFTLPPQPVGKKLHDHVVETFKAWLTQPCTQGKVTREEREACFPLWVTKAYVNGPLILFSEFLDEQIRPWREKAVKVDGVHTGC